MAWTPFYTPGAISATSYNYVVKTANYTAAVNDLVFADASGGAFTVTLPDDPDEGSLVAVVKTDSSTNVVTISRSGTALISGSTTVSMPSQNAGATFTYDGTNWQVLYPSMLSGPAGPEGPDGPISPKLLQMKVFDDFTIVSTGDGKITFCVPEEYNGLNVTSVAAYVTTVSSSGLPTVQLRRTRAGNQVDMLTTKISIDANELTSYTAAAPPVIDTANDDVATGDLISVDVDVAGTGAKGLGVIIRVGS